MRAQNGRWQSWQSVTRSVAELKRAGRSAAELLNYYTLSELLGSFEVPALLAAGFLDFAAFKTAGVTAVALEE